MKRRPSAEATTNTAVVAPAVTGPSWHKRKEVGLPGGLTPDARSTMLQTSQPTVSVVVHVATSSGQYMLSFDAQLRTGCATVRHLKEEVAATRGIPESQQHYWRGSPSAQAVDVPAVHDEEEVAAAEVTLCVLPLDGAHIFRRSKNFKRFITFEAWLANDELAAGRRKFEEAKARANAQRKHVEKEAACAAAFAAWSMKQKGLIHRARFEAGACVELCAPMKLDLFAPDGTAPAQLLRCRTVATCDALTVVARGRIDQKGKDPNWCVVETKDKWLCEVPVLSLVPPRRRPLSADEQYLADAGDRRKPAPAIVQEREQWGAREWRSRLQDASKKVVVPTAAAATPPAANNDRRAVDWLLKRLRGRGVRLSDLRECIIDKENSVPGRSVSVSELRRGLDALNVPITGSDLDAVWACCGASSGGQVLLSQLCAVLQKRAQRAFNGGRGGDNVPTGADAEPRGALEARAFEEWLQRKRRDKAVARAAAQGRDRAQAADRAQARAQKWAKKTVISAFSTMKK